MLTMRSPVQLNIGKGLAVTSDSFCQRLQANYGLLSARYTPKDLLFLMTAPPNLPEELGGGMTTIAVQNTATDARRISMEVVNNVVNRILLDGSPQFTYQDQVYITSVLQRLGVTNVEQFMAQVRQLRTENESVTRLTALYREEIRQLMERQAAGEPVPPLPLSAPAVSGADEAAAPSEQQLYSEIFRRLDTARLYETVHALQRSYTAGSNVFHNRELRLSEQLRLSNVLALSSLKQQFFHNTPATLLHHTNQYETGALLPPPQNETAVLSQATVASLVNAVDRAVVEVLNRPSYQSNHWLSLEHALHQTAENALARFEEYHFHPGSALASQSGEAEQTPLAPLAHYVQEFYQFHKLVQQLHPQPSSGQPPADPASAPAPSLTHLTVTEEGDALFKLLEQPDTLLSQTKLTRLTQSLLQQTVIRALPDSDQPPVSGQSAPSAVQPPLPPRRELVYREGETPPPHLEGEGSPPFPPTVRESAAPPAPQPVERVLLTPQEAEEQHPEVLLQQLTEIDRQNRLLSQQVQQTTLQQHYQLPRPDIQRTLTEALRTLDEPERALQELYLQPEAAALLHPDVTPEVAAILQQADPATRALYETVLRYQKDPESVLQQGILRPGNPAFLNQAAVDAQLLSASEPLSLEHPVEPPAPASLQPADFVPELLRELPFQRNVVLERSLEPPPSMRIVHKQAPPDVTEELLERLEQRSTQSVVRVESHDTVVQQQVQQTEVTEVQKQVVTQTTEDITALVNRTLSKQMRTISDQVYHQMEKKLQAERSRRGRL